MNLYWCKTTPPNVGDALNEWLWPKLIPEIDLLHPESTLFGIGSVLDERVNTYGPTYVIGSGARSREHGIKSRENLQILAVRGPLTASALGIDMKLSATDPAALLAYHYAKPASRGLRIGLVPYFSSPHEFWQRIADEMGLDLVSPHLGVFEFLDAISECDFVISEAMHGAIISDALRIPWHPIRSNSVIGEGNTNRFKWTDWCESVGIEFSPTDLPAIRIKQTGIVSTAKNWIKRVEIKRAVGNIINSGTRFLSKDHVFSERTDKLLCIIDDFRTKCARH